MRIHMVGVSGTGMGALAALFREEGDEVSGSDVAFNPPVGPMLKTLGVRCLEGYDAANLDPRPDLVVVGNAIRRTNVEAQAVEALALEGVLAKTSMSAALRERFLAKRRPLVVAGTHGKTTTSAMCAWLLSRAGYEPGWFIGGVPKGLPASAAIGSRRIRPGHGRAPFVVEGDEYDAVYWNKQPKFLDYAGVGPDDVAIVTSVEHDHIDIYPDVGSYEAAFAAFVSRVPEAGLVVCDAHDPRARALVARHARARVVWYALERDPTGDVNPGWVAAPAVPIGPFASAAQAFDLFAGGVSCGRFTMAVPGHHNVRNAVAAIAACAEGFGASVNDLRGHLKGFEGVRRRQDLLGEPRGVRVYDDFAHHPTAVDETLRALRARHPGGALWVAFEPRSATACRALHQDAYARAFDAADHVLLAPLGRSGLAEGDRLDLERLARELGTKAKVMPSVAAIVERIVVGAAPGDTVALFSNGAFGGIHQSLLEELSR
jgi:UDP-N-acetylmuramate: L-alanyl-gamma-D-glutamyl-meso-diaminopimelate ligase